MTCFLVVVHSIGVAIAAVAACGNIRSILLSGPILSLTGFMVALLSFRAHRRVGFYFGLAAPTVAVICLNLIAVFDWGPSEAQMPVGGMVVVLSIVSLPAGLVAVRECRRRALPQYPLPVQHCIPTLDDAVCGRVFQLLSYGRAAWHGYRGPCRVFYVHVAAHSEFSWC